MYLFILLIFFSYCIYSLDLQRPVCREDPCDHAAKDDDGRSRQSHCEIDLGVLEKHISGHLLHEELVGQVKD